jgi:hypothetical protein
MQVNLVRILRVWVSLFLCLLTGASGIASAQSAKEGPSDVAMLRAEVQRLTLELLRYRAEFIQWKMNSTSMELQQVQAERQRLIRERQLIEREIGDLNQFSADGPGGEDEGRREELKGIQLPAILELERTTTTREGTLVAALGAESARLTEIQKQVQRLTAQPATR